MVGQLAQKMIGYNLATKQTPKEGVKVNKVMFLDISYALKTKEERGRLALTGSHETLFFDYTGFV